MHKHTHIWANTPEHMDNLMPMPVKSSPCTCLTKENNPTPGWDREKPGKTHLDKKPTATPPELAAF